MCLSAALFWLLAVPLCPLPVAALLSARGAAVFLGCFLLGCALYCLARLSGRLSGILKALSSAERHTFVACLLPVGVLMAGLSGLFGALEPHVWCGIGGVAAGLGESWVLLRWGRALSTMQAIDTVSLVSWGCLGATLIGCLVCLAEHSPAIVLVLLAMSASIACLPAAPAFQRAMRVEGASASKDTDVDREKRPSNPAKAGRANADVSSDGTADREPTDVRSLFAQLWEPALGLGLSLMSAALPWGSFLSNGTISLPSYWSFALGIAIPCLAAAVAPKRPGRGLGKTPDFEMATHVVIPVLAAAVVGLRMLGDLEQIGVGLTAFKGIGSGAASVGFLLLALVAMAHVARNIGDSEGVFALGLGVACLIGFLTLPMHMAHQQFASLVAPFLSLVFLVASCCSSVVHIHRRVANQEPKTLTIEDAVSKLCHEYRLSPRERQVMEQLMLGRSAERIGAVLGISPNTVRSHVGNIHTKLGISSRDDLADLIEATMHGKVKTIDEKQPAQRPSS